MSKINMKDVTFVIPLIMDHGDCLENLNLVLDYINYNFDTNILVTECGKIPYFSDQVNLRCEYKFMLDTENFFHKTKILNDLYLKTSTNIVVSHEFDILYSIDNYIKSIESIRSNEFDFVCSYTNKWYDVPRYAYEKVRRKMDIDEQSLEKFKILHDYSGCLFFNKNKYKECGLENQYFYNYPKSDTERIDRIRKLNYKINFINDRSIHLYHTLIPKNVMNKKYFVSNFEEYNRIETMSSEQLKNYVSTWPWIGGKGPYNKSVTKPVVSNTKPINKPSSKISNNSERDIGYKPVRLLSMAAKQKIMEDKLRNTNSFLSISDVSPADNIVLMSSNNNTTRFVCDRINELFSLSSSDLIDYIYVINLGISDKNMISISCINNKVKIIRLPQLDKTFYNGYLLFDMMAWKTYAMYEARKLGKNVLWVSPNVKICKNISPIFDIIESYGIFAVKKEGDINKLYTSDRCFNLMNCTETEKNATQIYSTLLGYNTTSRYLKLFEEAFRYSKMKQCIYGDRNHRKDQSIFSILAERHKVPCQDTDLYGSSDMQNIKDYNVVVHL